MDSVTLELCQEKADPSDLPQRIWTEDEGCLKKGQFRIIWVSVLAFLEGQFRRKKEKQFFGVCLSAVRPCHGQKPVLHRVCDVCVSILIGIIRVK
jgi:hypothetical protein